MQNDKKLLPCPFCGGEAEIRKGFHELDNWVQCLNCSSAIGSHTTKETAIKKWNTRKPMERIVWQMEKRCSSFNCKVCRHYGDGTGTCNEDCTDTLIDDLIEIVKGGVDNAG